MTTAQKERLLIKPSLSGRDHASWNPYARGMGNFSYIIADPPSGEAWLIDPAWDMEGLLRQIEELGCSLSRVFLTHGHPDHCGGFLMGTFIPGVNDLPELLGDPLSVPIHFHPGELPSLAKQLPAVASWFSPLSEEERYSIGDYHLEWLATPGHTTGGVCYLIDGALFSGDIVFFNGTGRTDLPGGNGEEMEESIRMVRQRIEEGWKLFPGHNY